MDYNKLHTFTKVVEFGGISRAARVLRRTQSAITQQVQQLEDELGLQLFERRLPRLHLSAQGKRLYEHATRALGEVDDLVATLKDDVGMARGRLRLAALADGSTEFDIVAAVAKFRAAYPGVEVSLNFGSNERVEDLLRRGEADMACAIVFSKKEDLERHEVQTAAHLLVGSHDYLTRNGPFRTYQEIIEADLIDLSEEFICLAPWLRKNKPELITTLLHRTPNMVLPDHRSARAMVVAGLGLAIVPHYLIARELEDGTVKRVFANARDLQVGLDLAWKKGRELRLIERLFKDMTVSD